MTAFSVANICVATMGPKSPVAVAIAKPGTIFILEYTVMMVLRFYVIKLTAYDNSIFVLLITCVLYNIFYTDNKYWVNTIYYYSLFKNIL